MLRHSHLLCLLVLFQVGDFAATEVSPCEDKPFASREQGVFFDSSLLSLVRVPGVGPRARWAANVFINDDDEVLWMPADRVQ